MSTPQDDERWLDVLAGKAEPRNAEERQAARARQYFEIEAQQEQQVDPATLQRVENLLMAKLAAAKPIAPAEPAARTSWWSALSAWFNPGGDVATGRYAAVAVAVMAAVALPYMMAPPAPDADDPGTIKSPPAVVAPETVIASAQPADDAARLLQVLAAQGVVAALTEEGADRLVVALVPADKLTAVSDATQKDLGVPLPADGQLRVRFKASAP